MARLPRSGAFGRGAAGMRPAGMRPAGMRPAGMRPAGMRPAGGQKGFAITMMTIGIANRTGISFQTR